MLCCDVHVLSLLTTYLLFTDPATTEIYTLSLHDDLPTYRYAEASLDDNPIHVDPNTAKAAGLPDVILHGLCTMAMAGGSVVESQAGGDPLRLKRLGVRFARPVLNSSKLTTFGWNTDRKSVV